MDNRKNILLIEFCNFDDYPIGGYLTFAKNLIKTFQNELVLVGITTEKEEPVGKWFKKDIKGTTFDYFAIARYNKSSTKHFLPDRLVVYFLLRYFQNKILEKKISNIFIQRPEVLIATKKYNYQNICFRFAGLENPLELSKYWYGKHLASYFDKKFFLSFRNVNCILATGDNNAILEMKERSKKAIGHKNIIQFPTRIDTKIFKPFNKTESRNILNIPEDSIIVSTVGRLASFKGWRFMIDCFLVFLKTNPTCLFYLIGEGEDHDKINTYIKEKNIKGKVFLVGKKPPKEIVLYLNSSDIFIMGSYREGWSTSLLEAIATGVPSCTTNFSSAKEIIIQNVNGYVIDTHNIEDFVKKMHKALLLNRNQLPQPSQIERYSLSNLRGEILNHWVLK